MAYFNQYKWAIILLTPKYCRVCAVEQTLTAITIYAMYHVLILFDQSIQKSSL